MRKFSNAISLNLRGWASMEQAKEGDRKQYQLIVYGLSYVL